MTFINTASNKNVNSSTASWYFAHQAKWKRKPLSHNHLQRLPHLHCKQTQAVQYKEKHNCSGPANRIWAEADCILLDWNTANMNLVCLYHTVLILPESSGQSQTCYQIIQNKQGICGKLHLQNHVPKPASSFSMRKSLLAWSLRHTLWLPLCLTRRQGSHSANTGVFPCAFFGE